MSWLSVAAYSLTGTLTKPNDTAPFQIARMGCSAPRVTSTAPHHGALHWQHARCDRMEPMRPMLATRATDVPDRVGVAARGEVGRHAGARRGPRRRLRIRSRNEKDVKVAFPELHGLAGLGRDVRARRRGGRVPRRRPAFGALADRMHVGQRRAGRRRCAERTP